MIVTIVYFGVAVLCTYPFRTVILKVVIDPSKPDSFDKGASAVLGFLASLFWPLFLGCFIAFSLSKKIWLKLTDENADREKINR